ncbi:MAG: DUF2887 domain-containing protein [Armatimonadetes bacterium]|nr:DUF2887 domain-containing protein [Armatimonadota bacterium]
MKSDTLPYHLFQECPSIFFELIGADAREARHYTFSSVEIKQPAFRIDGVFLPKEGGEERPIYFVEV